MVALKTLIFSILVPGTVAFVFPWLLLQQQWEPVSMFPSVWLFGFLPLLLGIGLYLWCAGAFTFIGSSSSCICRLRGGAIFARPVWGRL